MSALPMKITSAAPHRSGLFSTFPSAGRGQSCRRGSWHPLGCRLPKVQQVTAPSAVPSTPADPRDHLAPVGRPAPEGKGAGFCLWADLPQTCGTQSSSGCWDLPPARPGDALQPANSSPPSIPLDSVMGAEAVRWAGRAQKQKGEREAPARAAAPAHSTAPRGEGPAPMGSRLVEPQCLALALCWRCCRALRCPPALPQAWLKTQATQQQAVLARFPFPSHIFRQMAQTCCKGRPAEASSQPGAEWNGLVPRGAQGAPGSGGGHLASVSRWSSGTLELGIALH